MWQCLKAHWWHATPLYSTTHVPGPCCCCRRTGCWDNGRSDADDESSLREVTTQTAPVADAGRRRRHLSQKLVLSGWNRTICSKIQLKLVSIRDRSTMLAASQCKSSHRFMWINGIHVCNRKLRLHSLLLIQVNKLSRPALKIFRFSSNLRQPSYD